MAATYNNIAACGSSSAGTGCATENTTPPATPARQSWQTTRRLDLGQYAPARERHAPTLEPLFSVRTNLLAAFNQIHVHDGSDAESDTDDSDSSDDEMMALLGETMSTVLLHPASFSYQN